jgi:hypothetical protein
LIHCILANNDETSPTDLKMKKILSLEFVIYFILFD